MMKKKLKVFFIFYEIISIFKVLRWMRSPVQYFHPYRPGTVMINIHIDIHGFVFFD